MPQATDDVMIAGDGDVYVAATGTTLPTTEDETLNAAFTGLGYINENGVVFRDNKTKEPIPAWQSFYPLKFFVTDASLELEFSLRQFDETTVPFALGGGSISTQAGTHTYTPPEPEVIDERAMVVEWQYDTSTFRLVVPRVMVTSGTEFSLTRAAPTDLPITVSVLGTAGVSPYTIVTDHASWNQS